MSISFRVEGIYDLRTLTFLREQGIFLWSFDLRAQSMNFVPAYKLCELLKKEGQFATKIFLRFENEKDFVVQKTLLDLKTECPFVMDKVILEFSDSLDVSFYNSFSLPFVWHFQNTKEQGAILNSNLLRGLRVEGVFLDKNFLMNLFSTYSSLLNREIQFILKLEEENILGEGMDFFDLLTFSLELSSDLEICYRNVDLKKLGMIIEKMKRIKISRTKL